MFIINCSNAHGVLYVPELDENVLLLSIQELDLLLLLLLFLLRHDKHQHGCSHPRTRFLLR